MRTPPEELAGARFDDLVVGAGIQGAAIARELALRGRRVLVVDAGDFAGSTSSHSSRLVHGGVRYLRHGHLSLVREALAERERLLRAAPHLVRPQPLLMPFLSGGSGRPWMLRLGLRLYDLLARGSSLPRARSLGAEACRRLWPELRADGLAGGALYFDASTDDLRLTLAVLADAVALGARAANHVEVVAATAEQVTLRDRLADAELEVGATTIWNVTGTSIDRVRRALDVAGAEHDLIRTSRGSHVLLPPRAGETGIAAFRPDGRILFVVPHRAHLLVGTTEVEEAPGPDTAPAPEADVEYLLDGLGWMFRERPDRADVQHHFVGWRALPVARPGQKVGALDREARLVTERAPAGAVHTVVGGKLTTHRALAERAVRQVLGDAPAGVDSRDRPLPGGEGPQDPGDPLWRRHGALAAGLRAAAAAEDPSLLEPLAGDGGPLRLEVADAVMRLGAATFEDLVRRRLFAGEAVPGDDDVLRSAFELFARVAPRAAAAGFEAARSSLAP